MTYSLFLRWKCFEIFEKAADYELGIKITDERVDNVCGQIDSRIRQLKTEIGECTKIQEKLHRSQADTRDAKNALRAQDYRKLELISQQYQKEIISYVAEWKYMMSMKNTGNDKARNDEHGPDYPGNPDEVSANNLTRAVIDCYRFWALLSGFWKILILCVYFTYNSYIFFSRQRNGKQ